ncbi:TspO/MBR family protein [Alkalihalophilus lindianensis]|uniref:TspO/MBR family protein n=1 Tax=Alkalihalophilus lindianensis TaxID=1630542 RepID=A0ABU3X5A5_9BACI|nr:TspO/MBR family protein [Alkalihalophilus lindianensis]MDV2683077.1 TspO/MBR family protein [Alkalihalophilus lindianensis]
MSRRFAIINTIALVAVLIVNYLSNSLPINGQTAGEISNRLGVLFTPAGYVFSIWGLIYLLLIIWVGAQFIPRTKNNPVYERVGYWFAISSILNIAWLLLFHYEFFNLTLIAMVGLLLSLIVIFLRIEKVTGPSLFRTPFSVYLGWVSVATIVNVGIVLTVNEVSTFGIAPEVWTALLLVVGAALAIWFMMYNRDLIYPLVFIWAFIGIAAERSEYPIIVYTAWTMVALIAIVWVVQFIRKRVA